MRALRLSLAVALLAVLCSCGGRQVSVPAPPQIKVSSASLLLAQSVHTATVTLIASRDAGSLSQTDLLRAENVLKIIAETGQKIDAELRKQPSDWTSQRTAILRFIAQAAVGDAAENLSPLAKAIVQAAINTYREIAAEVGSPTI